MKPSSSSHVSASASHGEAGWRLELSSASELPRRFFAEVNPTPVAAPKLVAFNRPLAEALGLSVAGLEGEAGAAIFAGNVLPPGARPIAQAYAGHQFGHFTLLGDGRAILLGEQITPAGGRFDVQLKGSGPTPYSRRGDGRAALGPMLREYIISEAMHALGIPTTRSLAVVATGEDVWRETALPGAVLTRVAASHLRVGTFQFAAATGDLTAVTALVNYALQRHFPGRKNADNPARALLTAVCERQAKLIAHWMLVGFVHGVMNTDNMAISGETIDYGPCAFIDAYDPATVFSSIDARGRYAFGNQPAIAQWNLTRFAETLVPLFDADEARAIETAQEALGAFATQYREAWLAGMRRKLGLGNAHEHDEALVEQLLGWMEKSRADFTNTFAGLERTLVPADPRRADGEFMAWHDRWVARLADQPLSPEEANALRRAANPVVIPRNHRVEAALSAAVQQNFKPVEELLGVLARPYGPRDDAVDPLYFQPSPPEAETYRTFCGT